MLCYYFWKYRGSTVTDDGINTKTARFINFDTLHRTESFLSLDYHFSRWNAEEGILCPLSFFIGPAKGFRVYSTLAVKRDFHEFQIVQHAAERPSVEFFDDQRMIPGKSEVFHLFRHKHATHAPRPRESVIGQFVLAQFAVVFGGFGSLRPRDNIA